MAFGLSNTSLLVLVITSQCSLGSLASANDTAFGIRNGRFETADVQHIGQSESCGTQSGDVYVCGGEDNDIKWSKDLGTDDFVITSDFKADKLDSTALTFNLWSGSTIYYVGLDGQGKVFFHEGGAWGRPATLHGQSRLTPSQMHAIRLSRQDGQLSVSLDGEDISGMSSLPLSAAISAFGWRPWRNQIHVKELAWTSNPWSQFSGLNQRCGFRFGCPLKDISQLACQQEAVAQNLTYFEYDASRGCCYPKSASDCATLRRNTANPWQVYRKEATAPTPAPEALWPQFSNISQRCGSGCPLKVIHQRACQQEAVAQGLTYFEYDAKRGCCNPMGDCATLRTNTSYEWQVYRRPSDSDL